MNPKVTSTTKKKIHYISSDRKFGRYNNISRTNFSITYQEKTREWLRLKKKINANGISRSETRFLLKLKSTKETFILIAIIFLCRKDMDIVVLNISFVTLVLLYIIFCYAKVGILFKWITSDICRLQNGLLNMSLWTLRHKYS